METNQQSAVAAKGSKTARLAVTGQGCECHQCHKLYTVDLMVPPDVWERIAKEGEMLCPPCIGDRMELHFDFAAYQLTDLSGTRYQPSVSEEAEDLCEREARAAAVKARPSHGNTGTCACPDCENVKWGVRWGFRSATADIERRIKTIPTTIEEVEKAEAEDETRFEDLPERLKTPVLPEERVRHAEAFQDAAMFIEKNFGKKSPIDKLVMEVDFLHHLLATFRLSPSLPSSTSTPCPKCKGRKTQPGAAYDPPDPCSECDGLGVIAPDPPEATSTRDVREAVELLQSWLDTEPPLIATEDVHRRVDALRILIDYVQRATTKPTVSREEMEERAREYLELRVYRGTTTRPPQNEIEFLTRFALEHASTPLDACPWIAVEGRLPETPNPFPVQVWVCIMISTVKLYDTAKFYKGEWTDSGGNLIEAPAKVVAWSSIPPYQPADRTDEGR